MKYELIIIWASVAVVGLLWAMFEYSWSSFKIKIGYEEGSKDDMIMQNSFGLRMIIYGIIFLWPLSLIVAVFAGLAYFVLVSSPDMFEEFMKFLKCVNKTFFKKDQEDDKAG